MTTSLLKAAYGLCPEIMNGWTEPNDSHFPINALNFAIWHNIEPVIDFEISFQKGHLNKATKTYRLTPLQIAVIVHNSSAVKKLIEAGAAVNWQDAAGWTSLHHAALAANQDMMELLLSKGADPELLSKSGVTYKFLFSRVVSKLPNSKAMTRLWWKDSQGGLQQMNCADFNKKTGATYLFENIIRPEQLCAGWKKLKADEPEFSFVPEIREKYAGFLKNPPPLILSTVMHDKEGRSFFSSLGLGLFAKNSFSPGDVVGEYLGEFGPPKTLNPYALADCDGNKFGNEFRQVNDGFNNAMLVCISDLHGMPIRNVFIAIDPIAPGEELCWNYGMHATKMNPYAELRPKDTREFIKKHELNNLMKSWIFFTIGVPSAIGFSDYALAEKFRYFLSTPSIFFTLTYEGLLNPKNAISLQAFSNTMGHIPTPFQELLKDVIPISLSCLRLYTELKEKFPETAKAYDSFVRSIIEKGGLPLALGLVQKHNRNLKSKISVLKTDQSLLHFWKKNFEPKTEESLLLSKEFVNLSLNQRLGMAYLLNSSFLKKA